MPRALLLAGVLLLAACGDPWPTGTYRIEGQDGTDTFTLHPHDEDDLFDGGDGTVDGVLFGVWSQREEDPDTVLISAWTGGVGTRPAFVLRRNGGDLVLGRLDGGGRVVDERAVTRVE